MQLGQINKMMAGHKKVAEKKNVNTFQIVSNYIRKVLKISRNFVVNSFQIVSLS